jgi:ATP-binding cassette subfamily B protein
MRAQRGGFILSAAEALLNASDGSLSEVLGSEAPLTEILHDISFDGHYREGKVIITSTRIIVVELGAVTRILEIKAAKNYKTVSLVGSGQLQAVIDGIPVALARFNMRQMPHFANAVKFLNKVAAGETTPFYIEIEEKTCPKCGRVYPDESRICPACINRAQVVWRLMKMARPHLRLIIIVMVLFWVTTALNLVGPQLNRMFIDQVLVPRKRDAALFTYYLSLITVTGVIGHNLVSMARGIVVTHLSSQLGQDLRNLVYGKIQALSLSYLSKRKTGDLMNRVNNDTSTIQTFIQQQLATAINDGLMLVGICAILFFTNWRLAMFVPVFSALILK